LSKARIHRDVQRRVPIRIFAVQYMSAFILSEGTSVTVLNAAEIAAQMLRIGDGLFQQVKFV